MRLRLNLNQTAEKLGITKQAVKKLEEEGKLTNLNTPKDGVTRIYRVYDSKQVNDVKRMGVAPKRSWTKPNGPARPRLADGFFTMLDRLETRLSSIEAKVDQLVAIWK